MSEKDNKHKKSYEIDIKKSKQTPVRQHKRSNPKSDGKHTVRRHMRTISKKAVSPFKEAKRKLGGSDYLDYEGDRDYTKCVDRNMDEVSKGMFPRDEKVDDFLEYLEQRTGVGKMQWDIDSWKCDTGIGSGEMGVYWISNDSGGEYMLVRDEDHAWQVATQNAEDQLRMRPESFNTDWLKQYMYLGEPDKRMLRSDIISREWDALEHEHPEWDREKIEEEAEKRAEREMERVEDDPYEYFREFGYDERDIIDKLAVEYEKASEDAVKEDGVVHFLPMYGESLEQVPDSEAMYWEVQ